MAKYVHFNFVVYIVVFILSIAGELARLSYRCFHGFPLTLLYCDFYGVSDVTLDAWAKTTHFNFKKAEQYVHSFDVIMGAMAC